MENEAEFWDKRYREGKTPWDLGKSPAMLVEFLAKQVPGRVLVPGCGSGYELQSFVENGWDVTAVDCSPEAVHRAKQFLPEVHGRILLDDFFAADLAVGTFDLIYERTFLCAIPPDLRGAYGTRFSSLIKPGGKLVGFFYLGELEPDGPPFAIEKEDLERRLSPVFSPDLERPSQDGLPVFEGREWWMEWSSLPK